MMKKLLLVLTLILLSFVLPACTQAKLSSSGEQDQGNKIINYKELIRLEPKSGCYFGIVPDLGKYSVPELSKMLGFTPSSYVTFVNFPMSSEDVGNLDGFVKRIVPTGGIVLITLEPFGGLEAINDKACKDFAAVCAEYEQQGIGTMVRFAHEMNGSWYPWSQKPALYKEKFRMLAEYIHKATKTTAMLWAPNNGDGYPFTGGTYGVKPGTADYTLLDTDGNNKLDENDDMYLPYYPGDDAVDWVGMTVYHWGRSYPWFENELPEPKSFADHLTGNYNGLNGDHRAVPDFYAMFCNDGVHNKPMAIPETSAFYNTEQAGANELDIKENWWNQVLNITGDTDQAMDISIHFPKIKMINWFDIMKNEAEAKGNIVDWRISGTSEIRQAFIDYFNSINSNRSYFIVGK